MRPKRLGSFTSIGMFVNTATDDYSQVELLKAPQGTRIGERVTLELPPIHSNHPSIDTAINAMKVMNEKTLSNQKLKTLYKHLRISKRGIATFMNFALVTS